MYAYIVNKTLSDISLEGFNEKVDIINIYLYYKPFSFVVSVCYTQLYNEIAKYYPALKSSMRQIIPKQIIIKSKSNLLKLLKLTMPIIQWCR